MKRARRLKQALGPQNPGVPVAYVTLTAELLARLPVYPWTLMGMGLPQVGDVLIVARTPGGKP